jgi:hypothetical protein
MKIRRVILSFAAVAIIVTHLMASGGLIMIIHTCTQHHTRNVTTFSVINPVHEVESCCKTEGHESGDSHIATGCCEYDVFGFNLSSFVPSSFFQNNDLQATSDIFTCYQETLKPLLQTARNVTFFNKHGGRYIVNINHQIIS